MSAATGARLPRLLALLPYLTAHPGVGIAEVAAEFGISEEQLRKDLDLLWMCGLPGHLPGDLIDLAYEGETVTVVFDAGLSRPLRLTADEALALLVALRALADLPGLAEREAVDRAIGKVEQAAGVAASQVAAEAVVISVEAESSALRIVQDALDRSRRLHLRYHVPARDEATERDVEPMRLLLVSGRTYLEAWCRRVEDVRLFRLDRMLAAEVLDAASEPPAEATPRDLAAGLYRPAPTDVTVTLELAAPARWVADYYPCERVTELETGGLRVALTTGDTEWITRLVLSLGGHARVLDPPALAAQVPETARLALAAYEEV